MSEKRPEWGDFSRVYHSVIDDPKFDGIYDNDRHFATWVRLLMIADMAWPTSAHIPMDANRRSVQVLADAGILVLLPNSRYRIHGLDPEREFRQHKARNAAAVRWHSSSNAHASDDAMPRRDETRRDETRINKVDRGNSGRSFRVVDPSGETA